MNYNTIAFLICGDSDIYYEEQLYYLNKLVIPQGYEAEVFQVKNSSSEAEAFMDGMSAGEAKYKIFLPENVFLYMPDMLNEMLLGFRNEKTGMISYKQGGEAFFAVQYDVPAESGEEQVGLTMEQICRAKIQKEGWTVQEMPMEEYAFADEFAVKKIGENDPLYEINRRIIQIAESGFYEELEKVLRGKADIFEKERLFTYVQELVEIFLLEKMTYGEKKSKWFESGDYYQLRDFFVWMRLLIIRGMLFDDPDAKAQIEETIKTGFFTKEAIYIISVSVPNNQRFIWPFLWEKPANEPLVSVVIPVHNRENMVGETIESVLSQNYQNMEIILVDDASTDNSRLVLSDYAKRDSRIKTIFLEKNQHVCFTANTGFSEASGKYLMSLGHDDLWYPEKVWKQVSFMEAHPECVVLFSHMDIVDENGTICNNKHRALKALFEKYNSSKELIYKFLIERGNYFCAPSMCIRKDKLDEAGYYKYGLIQLQDYELWIRLVQRGWLYTMHEALVKYRRFSNGDMNLSSGSLDTIVRDGHEKQWIVYQSVKACDDEFYQRTWSVCVPQGIDVHKAVMCHKAMLLWAKDNCFSEGMLLELLEDEECRTILENEFGMGLLEFYKQNTRPMLFDIGMLHRVKTLEAILEKQNN